jgi:hypothetical protein
MLFLKNKEDIILNLLYTVSNNINKQTQNLKPQNLKTQNLKTQTNQYKDVNKTTTN